MSSIIQSNLLSDTYQIINYISVGSEISSDRVRELESMLNSQQEEFSEKMKVININGIFL